MNEKPVGQRSQRRIPNPFFMVHIGVARWREQWISQRGHRVPGVWDPTLQRETLVLPDGRHLTYFLDGPGVSDQTARDGLPHIFVLHAMFLTGNSFLMREPPTDYVLVCVNRPGYFGSDLPPERTMTTSSLHRSEDADNEDGDSYSSASYSYETFAHDMERLARHLKLREFYVAGHSSGGPCALACAAHLPRRTGNINTSSNVPRVLAVGLLSSDPEYAHASAPNKRWMNRVCIGTVLPFCLRWILCCLPLARHARRGVQNDYRLETSLYSFDTEHDVVQPVLIYAGEDDQVLPVDYSRHLHDRLQNAKLHIVPKAGHLCLLRDDVLRDFFESLITMGQRQQEERAKEDKKDGELLSENPSKEDVKLGFAEQHSIV